jgi:hypothetical protein
MKVLTIVLGTLFGLWALGIVPFCIRDVMTAPSSAMVLSKADSAAAAIIIISLFSFWSFQSAFRQRKPEQRDAKPEE